MFCGKCGAKIEGNEKFCPVCGDRLCFEESNNKRNRKKSGRKKIWIGILLLLLIAVGITGGVALRTYLSKEDYIALAANEEGLYGYINTDGEPVIDYQYDLAFDFNPNGLAVVGERTDGSGKIISDVSYPEDYEDFHFYVIDTEGKTVFDLEKYDIVEYSPSVGENGLLPVGKKIGVDDDGDSIYRWGFVNEKGEEIIECQYDELGDSNMGYMMSWSNGWLTVEKNNQQGIIDEKGDYVIPLGDQNFVSQLVLGLGYSQGLIGVERDGMVGFVDKNNKTIIPFEYSDAEYFLDNGTVWVEKEVGVDEDGDPEYLWGMIDKENNIVIPFEYESMGYFGENGLAEVSKKVGTDEYGDPIYRSGCIDEKGNIVIPFEYEIISSFSNEGLAVACQDDEWYLIDEEGRKREKISYHLDNNTPEEFIGTSNSTCGLISIYYRSFDYYTYYYTYYCAIIDREGELFYPIGESEEMDYSIITSIEDRMIIGQKEPEQGISVGSKVGLVDEKGNVILPFIYSEMHFCPVGRETWVLAVNSNTSGEMQKCIFFDFDGNAVLEMPEGYFCRPFVKINH